MNQSYHIAVDLGATSGRTILASFDGKRVEMRELSRFKYPMMPLAGHLYWNLPYIYQAVIDSIDSCNEPISSIGIDSWGCDVAYFNNDGSIAGLPFCYRDSHTEGAVEKFANKMPLDPLYAKTGIQFMDFNTLFQLNTIRQNTSALIDNASKMLFISDALAYMLTGNAVTEFTIASTSQMLNIKTRDFDSELLDILEINRSKFGPMVQPGSVVGEYKGIPVIAVAGHDTASAIIGIPTPDSDYAYLSCGTWSLLGVESPIPIINEKSRQYNFTNEGGFEGTTRVLKNICGLWIFEQCRQEFKDVPDNVGELVDLYKQSRCESIINPDDPSFAHPGSMIAAIDSYCCNTKQDVPITPADYVRVIFRSLARRYKEVLEWLREIYPVEIKRLHVIGGGSLNSYLMQLTANETGLQVVAGPTESTALGNILVQLRATGSLNDIAAMRKVAIDSVSTKTYLPQQF